MFDVSSETRPERENGKIKLPISMLIINKMGMIASGYLCFYLLR